MRKFICMQFWIKVVLLNRSYSTNTKPIWNDYIPVQEPDNYYRSKPEIFRVFRLVSYLLNMICLNLQILYKIAYIWISYKFDIVLYQFLETGTSDRWLRCIVQLLMRFSGFILYPLSYFLYSPLRCGNSCIVDIIAWFWSFE